MREGVAERRARLRRERERARWTAVERDEAWWSVRERSRETTRHWGETYRYWIDNFSKGKF